MLGPLARVGTITESISLDINRKLNWGRDKTLKFVVPDTNQFNDWQILLIVSKGFDRITSAEDTNDDGREVIFRVADLTGAVGTIIRTKDLHVMVDSDIYSVESVPLVAPNVAQVFAITCKTRTLRTKYFENKRF